MRTVVVTGTNRHLGARVAARLAADPGVGRVIGVDVAPASDPPTDRPRDPHDAPATVEFVRADLPTGEVASVIAAARPDTVVHLAVVTSPHGAGGRAAMKEQNVIGTMQLLAACQQVPTLRKLVVRSSTAAYGASFRDPAVFTEDTEPREVPRGGFARDILDIEGYVRGFCRRRPGVAATVLRFAPFVGRHADTTLTRYFSRPLVPTVLGRDPRLQFAHLDDALEVLHRSVTEDHPGTYNVAGPGVLLLSQAIRRAGRVGVPVPEPGLAAAAALVPGFSLDQVDLFVHGRVVDTCRLEEEYGFTPRPTAEAFDDFVRANELGLQVRRRPSGGYEVDDFGFDSWLTDEVIYPALRLLYRHWFRVEVSGVDNLPATGPALVVANHSGTVPVDSLMLSLAVHDEHPAHRHLRLLAADLVLRTPVLSELARKFGGTLACHPDAERLLRRGELVGVFPEGFKGVGKPYWQRYQLQRFGRGGFISAALRTKTPIVPVAIVGAEEIYPLVGNVKALARLLGTPYFPVTPAFPWLGPLGLVPLPSKWLIEFGEPIDPTPWVDRADDPAVVFNLTDQVREAIQAALHRLLDRRPDPFPA